jgi:hypothetical protein
MSTSTTTTRATSATGLRSVSPFLRRLVLCLALTALNIFVVAKLAGVLYQATFHDKLKQIVVTLLFTALLGSLVRTWFLTLSNRRR